MKYKYKILYKGEPLLWVKDEDGDYRLDDTDVVVHHTSATRFVEYDFLAHEDVEEDPNFSVVVIPTELTVADLKPGTLFSKWNQCLFFRTKDSVEYVGSVSGTSGREEPAVVALSSSLSHITVIQEGVGHV